VINEAPRGEDMWGTESIAPLILISTVDGDEWSASRPGRFTHGDIAPVTHWIGG
jgi:hypothetical protein